MSEEEIKKIAKEEFMNNVMEQLDSTLIFTYIQKLENQLQQKDNIIKEVREYIETLRNYRFNVDLGENREQLEIVGSTENFVKDILEILDKEKE